MKPKKPARKKVKPVKVWGLQHRVAGLLFSLGTPLLWDTKDEAVDYLLKFRFPDTWKVVRVTITIED